MNELSEKSIPVVHSTTLYLCEQRRPRHLVSEAHGIMSA